MVHRNVLYVSIAIICISGVSGTFLVLYNQSTGLRWGVELGQEITYAVKVTGYARYWAMNGSLSPPPHAELNNTLFTIRIDSLPQIPAFLNGATFAENILSHVKTSVIEPIQYVNGTQVVSGNYSFLNDLVSISILPVGNWAFIDSLYPDTPDFPEGYCNTYFASSGPSFMIGYRYFLIDAGYGWHAMIDMETGLPANATMWGCEYYRDPWYSYELTLTPLLAD